LLLQKNKIFLPKFFTIKAIYSNDIYSNEPVANLISQKIQHQKIWFGSFRNFLFNFFAVFADFSCDLISSFVGFWCFLVV